MPHFVSMATSVTEVANGEKSRTHSLTDSDPVYDPVYLKSRERKRLRFGTVLALHTTSRAGKPRSKKFLKVFWYEDRKRKYEPKAHEKHYMYILLKTNVQ